MLVIPSIKAFTLGLGLPEDRLGLQVNKPFDLSTFRAIKPYSKSVNSKMFSHVDRTRLKFSGLFRPERDFKWVFTKFCRNCCDLNT